MAKITCDLKKIYDKTGFRAKEVLLTSHTYLDAQKSVTPIMVEADNGRRSLIIKSIDRGNTEYAAPKNVDDFYYYNQYFIFDNLNKPKKNDYSQLIDAFEACVLNSEDLLVPGDMVTDTYYKLAEKYNLEDDFSNSPEGEFYIYERSCDEINNIMGKNHKYIGDLALGLFDKDETRNYIKPYIQNRVDNRFTYLDNWLEKLGLTACMLSSPLNVQEVAGIPMREIKNNEFLVLYKKGDEKVSIISKVSQKTFNNGRIVPSLSEAIKGVLSGKIGIESEHLQIAKFIQTGLAKDKCLNITGYLRQWREERGMDDLAYYIIGAKGTAYGLDNALLWAKTQLASGNYPTEREIDTQYRGFLDEYQKKNNLPVHFELYFTTIYDSSRTLYPALPVEHVLSEKMCTLKLDAAILVVDDKGFVHAASDSARMLCFTPQGEKLYGLFEKLLRRVAIPGIKPGLKGKDVWLNGVQPLIDKQEWIIKELGMMPKGYKLKDVFNRDMGHMMSKQTRAALELTKNQDIVVKEGMVGTIEYVWSYKNHSFGIEDMYFVTDKGAVNITLG